MKKQPRKTRIAKELGFTLSMQGHLFHVSHGGFNFSIKPVAAGWSVIGKGEKRTFPSFRDALTGIIEWGEYRRPPVWNFQV